MKKILFGLLFVSIMFLSACDDPPKEETGVPILKINGELDITLGLNDDYVDEGVAIIGDFDLDVTTDNQVDTSKYGIYSVWYTANYDGEEISASRKVRVVRETEKDFDIQLNLVSEDPFALTFSISIDDVEGELVNGQAVLTRRGEVIDTQAVANGTNALEFLDLSNNSYYLLELQGSYFVDGVEYDLTEYFIGGNTTAVPYEDYPRLEIIGDAEIILQQGDTYVDQGARIVGEGDYDITVDSPVNTEVPGTYTVFYSIVFNETTLYAHRKVIVEPGEPTLFEIDVQFVEAVEDSLIFSVTVDDPDGLITEKRGVLYLGNREIQSFVYTNGVTMMNFDNLMDNTTYRFELEGMYILDGNSVSIDDYILEAKTLEISNISLFALNGEETMEIQQYSDFVDPGATYYNEPNAVIEVVSNLDTSTPGIYFITYTASLGDVYYNLIRTVTVVAGEAIEFGIELEYVSNTESSLTYTLTVGDNYDLMDTHYVRLYEFTTLVEEREFVAGENTFTFTNLKPGTDYSFYTYGTYSRGGYTESIGDYYRTDTTKAATAPIITLTSYEIGLVDIDVLVNVNDEHSQIIEMKVVVYTDDEYEPYDESFADLVNGDNQILLENLMYEYDYKLFVEYTYIDYATQEFIEVSEELLVFSTLTPPKPELVSIDCDRESTSFTCTAEWDIDGFNPDDMWYFLHLSPWNGSYKVIHFENNGTTLTFDGLEPGVDYVITVFADYVVTDTSERYISPIDKFYLEIKLRPFE